MNSIWHGILMLVLFLNATIIAKAQDSIFLKLRLRKGEKYEYAYTRTDTIEKDISLWLLQNKIKVPEQEARRTLMIIKDIDSNGNYIIEARQNRLKLTSRVPFIGTVSYDSDSSGFNNNLLKGSSFEEIYDQEFLAVLHHSYKFILSPAGEVISVYGVEQILDAEKDSIESVTGLSIAQKDKIIKNLAKSYNDLSYKRSLNDFFDVLPDGWVSIGDNWRKTHLIGTDYPERDTYYYSLKNIRGDSVFIDVKGNIYSPGDTAANGTPTLMTGTLTGTLIIDKNTGLIMEERTYSYGIGTEILNKKAVKARYSTEEVDDMKRLPLNTAANH